LVKTYEHEIVTAETYKEKKVTVNTTILVSKYKVFSTLMRVIVTRIVSELVLPGGDSTRFSIPTRYVETEYYGPMTTVFAGVVSPTDISVVPESQAPKATRTGISIAAMM